MNVSVARLLAFGGVCSRRLQPGHTGGTGDNQPADTNSPSTERTKTRLI